MPTISESPYEGLKMRYEQAIKDFVDGTDSEDVLRARLFGLGYKGANLATEMNLAKMQRWEKTSTKNYNCDNDKCTDRHSEVRLYPTGGGGNMILCRSCFDHENQFRFERAIVTRNPDAFPHVDWHKAEVYKVAGK